MEREKICKGLKNMKRVFSPSRMNDNMMFDQSIMYTTRLTCRLKTFV